MAKAKPNRAPVTKAISIDPQVWDKLRTVKNATGISLSQIVERSLVRVIEMPSKDASAFLNRG